MLSESHSMANRDLSRCSACLYADSVRTLPDEYCCCFYFEGGVVEPLGFFPVAAGVVQHAHRPLVDLIEKPAVRCLDAWTLGHDDG